MNSMHPENEAANPAGTSANRVSFLKPPCIYRAVQRVRKCFNAVAAGNISASEDGEAHPRVDAVEDS